MSQNKKYLKFTNICQKLFDFKNLLKFIQLIFYLRTLSSRDDKTY